VSGLLHVPAALTPGKEPQSVGYLTALRSPFRVLGVVCKLIINNVVFNYVFWHIYKVCLVNAND
jgi:hypothetical protein